ncbi:AAA family ATPase [Salmonella enterica]|nr:AAA family ATPase [Salmonella enterica]EBG4966870.1 AAA family ATPase [Salmonella enterica subsp. enterica serovar Agoueve]EEG5084172.1 AAA family ATPase [Salmonella enterica subsp. enterica]EAP7980639.1 AAA family ATPase [Salmonella enterica]EAR2102418.1 AAA family ATPase [Salmonella enterica]
MAIDWDAKPSNTEATLDENGDVIEWTDENGIRYDAFGNAIPTKILCAIEKEEIKLQSEKRLRPIIEHLFNRKQVGFLYGESNTGKSFAALSLLNRVAQGRPWSGLRVAKECHAFYFDGETGVEVKDRNTAWSKKFNGGIKNERMHILSPQINLFDVGVQNIIISDINSITNNKGGIICFDTLSSFLAYYSKQCIDGKTTLDMDNPDENDAIAMRKLVSILKRIAVETNSFVLMVHHGGKDAAKGMKGAITLKNDCDTVIKLALHDDVPIQNSNFAFSVSLTVEKNRSAAKLPVMKFDLCSEDNGITQQELHEIDNELCDYPDEGETGYEVKNSTKTLVFIDKPNNINDDGKTNKEGAFPGRKQAGDESLEAKSSHINKYTQAHTHRYPPMTQQQQQDKIEINQSDGYAREVAKDFTEGARINNNNHFLYNLALEKLKRSPGQREYYEEIHKNICLNPYAKTINLECFLNDRVRATGKRKDAIKKALTIMVDKGVIEMDNKTISLPKKQAPIMSV